MLGDHHGRGGPWIQFGQAMDELESIVREKLPAYGRRRVERPFLPGEARGRTDGPGAGAGLPVRLPLPGRPVRELVGARGGDSFAARSRIGAYLGIWICGLENNIYFQIGLVMLVGLVAKNAILIVEFAKEEVEKGRDVVSAALKAARLRFRPIVMTSLAFILGLLPLVFASGPGSASRQGIGTGVFFGMLVAISVGIVYVPFFFVWIYRIKAKLKKDETRCDIGHVLLRRPSPPLPVGGARMPEAPELNLPGTLPRAMPTRSRWPIWPGGSFTATRPCAASSNGRSKITRICLRPRLVCSMRQLYRIRRPSVCRLSAPGYATAKRTIITARSQRPRNRREGLGQLGAGPLGNLRWAKRKGGAEYLSSVEDGVRCA